MWDSSYSEGSECFIIGMPLGAHAALGPAFPGSVCGRYVGSIAVLVRMPCSGAQHSCNCGSKALLAMHELLSLALAEHQAQRCQQAQVAQCVLEARLLRSIPAGCAPRSKRRVALPGGPPPHHQVALIQLHYVGRRQPPVQGRLQALHPGSGAGAHLTAGCRCRCSLLSAVTCGCCCRGCDGCRRQLVCAAFFSCRTVGGVLHHAAFKPVKQRGIGGQRFPTLRREDWRHRPMLLPPLSVHPTEAGSLDDTALLAACRRTRGLEAGLQRWKWSGWSVNGAQRPSCTPGAFEDLMPA